MKRILFLLFIPAITFGQTKIEINHACSYFGEKLPSDVYSFSSDAEAQTSLARITNASGLPTNFKLVAGNVPNACATLKWNPVVKGYDRYIIYNQTFMQRLRNLTNDWSALSILAHEVGHHLSGHSLVSGGSRPELELEADKFSGFILKRLGASLDQAQTAVNTLSSENYSLTHPSKSARLAAIANGWFSESNVSQNSASKPKEQEEVRRYPTSDEFVQGELTYFKSKVGNEYMFHNATGYFFIEGKDFSSFFLENGDRIVWFKGDNCYWRYRNFRSLAAQTGRDIQIDAEVASCSKVVFIRSSKGGGWIYDHGVNVTDAKHLGYSDYQQIIYGSNNRGRRYWIKVNDWNYGELNRLFPVHYE